MFWLSSDESFRYELLRWLSLTRYGGGDVADIMSVIDQIKPGDFESFSEVFDGLAQRSEKQVERLLRKPKLSPSDRVSVRDKMFAAASYYRGADFLLHGNPEDPRIQTLWDKQTACFDEALSVLEYRATRHTLQADGFEVPAIFYRSNLPGPRPTMIACNGFDGAQEEMLHVCGFGALERGWNFLSYEGPGQPTPMRTQKHIGLIPDWERVIKPVVDFALMQPEVDGSRIAELGYSLGGYFATRVACFEHRVAAHVAIDGVWDFSQCVDSWLAPDVLALYETDRAAFDKKLLETAYDPATPTPARWGLTHALWNCRTRSGSELMDKLRRFALTKELVAQIKTPVFIGDAEQDFLFARQPDKVKEMLGDNGHLRYFSDKEGAGTHCQVGVATLLNQEVYGWLEEIMHIE